MINHSKPEPGYYWGYSLSARGEPLESSPIVLDVTEDGFVYFHGTDAGYKYSQDDYQLLRKIIFSDKHMQAANLAIQSSDWQARARCAAAEIQSHMSRVKALQADLADMQIAIRRNHVKYMSMSEVVDAMNFDHQQAVDVIVEINDRWGGKVATPGVTHAP